MENVDLEKILKVYFNCKKPIKKNGKLSKRGWVAYDKLIELIYDVGTLVEQDVDTDFVETLDMIVDEGE